MLSKATFIFCRDNESLKLLRSVGVASKILEFGPDGCFAIDVHDDAKAVAFMQANGLEAKKFITVTLRADKEVSVIQSEETGGLTALNPDEWAPRLPELITAWVKRTGLKVAIVTEVGKEIGPRKRLLLNQLPEVIRAQVVHLDRWWTVEEATAFCAQAHTVIDHDPIANAFAALDRIIDRDEQPQQKVIRAMAFVNARSAGMIGDVRRAIG